MIKIIEMMLKFIKKERYKPVLSCVTAQLREK